MAAGNNTDRFRRTLGPVGVDNGDHNLFTDDPDGMPTLLAMLYPVHEREAILIVENELGSLKAKPMPFAVAPRSLRRSI